MNTIIQQVDLRRYLPFFEPCLEKNYALAIYSQYGKRYFLEASFSAEQIIEILASINNKIFNWDDISIENNFHDLDKQGYCQFSELIVGANEEKFWLIAIFQTTTHISQEQQTQNQSKLDHIACCFQDDYALNDALNGMADELAVRYEELNLLYGIDDIDSYYNNQSEKEALRLILENCIDYLKIAMAVIYLPELEICFQRTSKQTDIDQGLLINIVHHQVLPYIEKNRGTLVINRDQDNDWTDAGLKIPYKFIVAPITKINQNINGVLVLINQLESPDFTNSDRKLTEILSAEASKLTQARRDHITGELNRRGITESLNRAISIKNINPHCLLLINIDQFKVVNDTSGQTGGDKLLIQINALIKKNLKKNDAQGRLGADEFAVILDKCSIDDAIKIANRIRIEIKQFRYFYQEKLFDISACVSVVDLTSSEIENFSEALSAADLACSIAKDQGRNRTHVYSKNDENLLTHENQMQWVSRINLGLEENRFLIYRQRILPLQEVEALDHYEILLRLKDKEGKIISPFHFIPAAERYGLMTKLDKWVVQTTLEKLAYINKTQPENNFSCSINLSGQSFCEEGFSTFILEQIKLTEVPPERLCFEITETAAVSNMTMTIKFMEKIKAIGCKFSLDDFGSGMSSFTYLKNLPVDTLKIDGYFVKTMLENKIDNTMVTSIHQIGNVMGLKTIAEFVETDAILEELKIMGIDYGQGYHIGKPEHF